MNISIKEMIVIHVCYRDIFSAPVCLEDLKSWIGIKDDQFNEFEAAISELRREALIDKAKGYITAKGKVDLISLQPGKDALSDEIIARGEKVLKILGRFPFIRYIGVSGSVAANNPTVNTHGIGIGHIDLDLFMITSKNSLWLFILFERLCTNVIKLLFGGHFYCFNYVTDESFLEIYNKNFFTATEIVNVKTLVNKGVYSKFENINKWYSEFYPGHNGFSRNYPSIKDSVISKILWLPNYLCFSAFCIGRAMKRFEYDALKELNTAFNPINKCNLKRIANPKGGYQDQIKLRFEKLMQANFPNYYSQELIDHLFPISSLFGLDNSNVHDREHQELFRKYEKKVANA